MSWINEDPDVKEFLKVARSYYTGKIDFLKNGHQYTAELDPCMIKLEGLCCQKAYFDIYKSKGCNVFILRLEDGGSEVNITISNRRLAFLGL